MPTCPACRYDLSGLPDGPCPECGTHFVHALLIAEELDRRAVRPPTHATLILAIALALAPCFWAPIAELQVIVLLLIWGMTGAWIYMHQETLARDQAARVLWLIIPVVRTGAVFLALPAPWLSGLVMLAIIIAIIAFAYVRQPIATVRSLGIAASVPLLLIGGGLIVHAAIGMAAGHYWSPWDYPLWGSINYPWRPRARALPYPHLLAFGLISIGAALVPGILALAMLSLKRQASARGNG